MDYIQQKHFTEALVPVPPNEVVMAADKVIAPLALQVVDNKKLRSRTLAILRDSLLPRLLSGELRVAGDDRKVAGAVS